VSPVVDAHTHLYPRWYLDRLRDHGRLPRLRGAPGAERLVMFAGEGPDGGRPIDESYWEIEAKAAFLEREGIDQAVVSMGNPWLEPFAGPESVELAWRFNEEAAALEGATGGRLCGMGVLPAHDVESAVAVAAHTARTPQLHGLITGTRLCGRLLDDAALDPLWAALERGRVPVFLHPHHAVATEELAGFGHASPVGVGFPFETTVALWRLVLGGVLERFPGLAILAAHGGGTVPFLAARMDSAWRSDASAQTRLSHPPSEDLAKLHLDAVLYHPRAMRAAADLVGADRMVYGTDHPFSIADPASNLAAVEQAFPRAELDEVLATTSVRLFGLPPVLAGPSGEDPAR
jgi:aminocarboxymuconate-semialdehyde decarboxylase